MHNFAVRSGRALSAPARLREREATSIINNSYVYY